MEFTVISTNGFLVVDKEGRIIERKGLPDIQRVDIQSYLGWCQKKEIPPAETLDILCLGIWESDGSYSEPEENALNYVLRINNSAFAIAEDIYGSRAEAVLENPTKEEVYKIHRELSNCNSLVVMENFNWSKGREVIKNNLRWFEEKQLAE